MKTVFASIFCLAIGACASADTQPSASTSAAPGTPPSRILESGAACAPEAYAYSGVLVLADQLGDDADILEASLVDLRQQLADCLSDPEPDLLLVANRKRLQSRSD
ncbi:MAG TPA: hypothetical protein VEJ16_12725 [Alphaproteobacteria bacterium]|nr:hypothetical protein [Alphaproteobacteria bacterium]